MKPHIAKASLSLLVASTLLATQAVTASAHATSKEERFEAALEQIDHPDNQVLDPQQDTKFTETNPTQLTASNSQFDVELDRTGITLTLDESQKSPSNQTANKYPNWQ